MTNDSHIKRCIIGYSESSKSYIEILNVYNSHKPLARSYAIKPSDFWCDCFVSACAIKARAVDIIGTEAGCERHIAIFKKKGIWNKNGFIKPKVGDIILYNWDDKAQPNDGFADHIGFVEKVSGDAITCIEGNLNNKIGRRTIKVGDGRIRGYARPKYSSTSSTKSIIAISQEVIAGKLGNDPVRKARLTKAGYNYSEVKKK